MSQPPQQSMTLDQALRLALQHHQAGRTAEAESIYKQILASYPDQSETLNLYAVLAFHTDRAELAEELARKAIQINPSAAGYYTNLGRILAGRGRIDQAIESYEKALSIDPNAFDALNNLANALREKQQMDRAVE